MANPVVRAAVFYWRNRKAYEANKISIKFMNGRKELFGAEGLFALSKGAAMVEVTVSDVIPVGGSVITNDITKILNQEDIDAAVLIGGKYYRSSWAVTDNTMDSDSETGVCTGSVTLKTGTPKITG